MVAAQTNDPLPVSQEVGRPENPRPVESRLTHGVLLAAAVAVPVLAAAMTTVGGDRVAFAGFERFTLPTLCVTRSLGLPCPTCGMTRSVIALAAGDIAASLHHHRLGWLVLGLILTQIPYRGYRLAFPTRPHPRLERAGVWTAVAAAVAVAADWFVRMI